MELIENIIFHATKELLLALDEMKLGRLDTDEFGQYNKEIFAFEESGYEKEGLYRALSLVCISLIDLGILEVDG